MRRFTVIAATAFNNVVAQFSVMLDKKTLQISDVVNGRRLINDQHFIVAVGVGLPESVFRVTGNADFESRRSVNARVCAD